MSLLALGTQLSTDPGNPDAHVAASRLPPESNLLISELAKSVTYRLLLESKHIPVVYVAPVLVSSVSSRFPLESKCFTWPLPIAASTSPLCNATPFALATDAPTSDTRPPTVSATSTANRKRPHENMMPPSVSPPEPPYAPRATH